MAESTAAAVAADEAAVTAAATQGRKTVDVPWISSRFVQFGATSGMNFTRDSRPDEISFHTYDEMRKDAILAAGLTLIKAPILGRLKDATIACEDPAIKAVIQHVFLDSGLFFKLVRTSLTAYDFGVAFHEIEWCSDPLDLTYSETDEAGNATDNVAWSGPGLWPKAFHDVNPNTVAYIRRQRPGDGSYDGFVQRASPEPIVVEAVNSFLYINEPEWGNYWGKPLLKPGYPQYFWKQAVQKFWMGWVEKKADPPRKGFHPIGETDGVDNSDLIMDAALGLSNNAAVSIPSEAVTGSTTLRAWDIEELPTTDRTDVFRLTKQELDSDLLKSIFAPERTFSPARDTGTYSESSAHRDTFLLTEDGRQEDLLESINRYAVARVVELNFGPDAETATINLPGITDEERDKRRALLEKLIASSDPSLGGVLDLRGLAQQEELPVTEQAPLGAPPTNPTPAPPVAPPGAPRGPESASSTQPAGQAPALHFHLDDGSELTGRSTLPDEATLRRIEARALELADRFLRKPA